MGGHAEFYQTFLANMSFNLSGALHDLQKRLGCPRETIMEIIDELVNAFFVRSLQLDAVTLRLKYE